MKVFGESVGKMRICYQVLEVQKSHQAKKKKRLYITFVHLEMSFDKIPRVVERWDLRKLSVDERLIRTVITVNTETCTVVTTDAGLSESFKVNVGLHKCVGLSPLLFAVVSSEKRSGVHYELLYADDLVLMSPTIMQLVEL